MFSVSLEKKNSGDMGGMGAFGPLPVGGPAPTYAPYKNKNGRNQAFLAFYIFCHLHSHPHPPKKESGAATVKSISNLVFKACEHFSGVKIHVIWRLVLRLVRIFT